MVFITCIMPLTGPAIITTWKFVVEFEDDETNEISAILGQVYTAECEGSIEDEVQYQCCCGRTVLNIEALTVSAECEGEKKIPIWDDGSGVYLGRVVLGPFAH
jgi:hypothetical protein